MGSKDVMDPVEWVNRVNQTWIVRHGLAERAAEWLAYLERMGDGRLERSCAAAHAMSHLRDRSEDPKPWFYAGLFRHATAEEVKRFLVRHRLTPASVPAMWDDEEVGKWIETIGHETRILLSRLRSALITLPDA